MRYETIWFPAKRYGWGWGLPLCWQGWLVLLGYAVLVAASALVWLPAYRAIFFLSLVGLTLGLVGICWLKGEPPRWRWGGD